jgi:hypothetical protein
MKRAPRKRADRALDHALARIAAATKLGKGRQGVTAGIEPATVSELIAADLAACSADGRIALTAMGRARLARLAAAGADEGVGRFRSQHLALARRSAADPGGGAARVVVNDAESPLAWLARRRGKDGRTMIAPVQFHAGERLRADFTFAQLAPQMAVDWSAPIRGAGGASAGAPAALADTVLAARQRLRRALDAAGPEFAGLLVDVCCFLKGLEDVERERGWPPRSAKVVLQLGLDRLVRHYGLAGAARGRARVPLRTWLAPGECFTVDAAEPVAD